MISSHSPIVKDLVLIGGGHSHVAVLKQFGMRPIPGVKVTLISRDVQTPYSGMLPGYVAGHYSFDQSHVDLRPLSVFSNARLYNDEVIGLDLINKKIICNNRPSVTYDLLSINIGSSTNIGLIDGAFYNSTPVKPINTFLSKWHAMLEEAVLGIMSSIDAPGSPAGEVRAAFHHLLHGRSAYHRENMRQRYLEVRQDDVKRVAEKYLNVPASLAVVTSEQRLAELNGQFNIIKVNE